MTRPEASNPHGTAAQPIGSAASSQNPFLLLMTLAAAHAKLHGSQLIPALSPEKSTLGPDARVHVAALKSAGFAVIPWTVNDEPTMGELLSLHVDGMISDRPDLLMAELNEARERAVGNRAELAYLDRFDAQGHRGARGIRPENTLPAFEAGLDHGITSIETDTGVTADHQSLIWHDQFLNPQSCRRADGQPYTFDNRVYIQDISMAEAQRTFICDKLHFGPDQKNDLSLSPVAVAFAAKEGMISPYAPTHVAQLFRFVNFYADWHENGPGNSTPDVAARARTGRRVRFNFETKILPPRYSEARVLAEATGQTEEQLRSSGQVPPWAFAPGKTVSPEVFVDTLCSAIQASHMEDRSEIQSFDFRTLLLVQQKYPKIRTFYLTQSPLLLSTELLPEALGGPVS